MKNYMEQFRVSLVTNAADYTAVSVLNGVTDVKIEKNKVWDTSSSANDYAGLSVGNIIKMTGWAKEENNGIFKVVAKEAGGQWIQLDSPLIDEPSVDSPGITMIKTPKSWTVTGVTVGGAYVMGATDVTNPAAFGPEYFKVTATNVVSSFATLSGDTDGDEVFVYWAKLSEG